MTSQQYASEIELAQVSHALAYSAVGSRKTVEQELRAILKETDPDELLIAGHFTTTMPGSVRSR